MYINSQIHVVRIAQFLYILLISAAKYHRFSIKLYEFVNRDDKKYPSSTWVHYIIKLKQNQEHRIII